MGLKSLQVTGVCVTGIGLHGSTARQSF